MKDMDVLERHERLARPDEVWEGWLNGLHDEGPGPMHSPGFPVDKRPEYEPDGCDGADRPAEAPDQAAASETSMLWLVFGYVDEGTGEAEVHVYPDEKREQAENLYTVYVAANLDGEMKPIAPERYVEVRDRMWAQITEPEVVFHDHCGDEVIELRKPVGG